MTVIFCHGNPAVFTLVGIIGGFGAAIGSILSDSLFGSFSVYAENETP